jgi:preprotein translocase subunit SecG
MTLWTVLLTVVEVLCAVLLVLLVLLQRSKDEGLGMAFGNAMGESLFGAQATTILTKGTVVLAVVFLLNTIVLDRLYSHGSRVRSGSIMDKVTEGVPVPPPVEAPPAAPAAVPETAVPAAETVPAPAFNPQPVPAPIVPATPAPAAAEPAAAPAPAAPAPAAAAPASPVPQT